MSKNMVSISKPSKLDNDDDDNNNNTGFEIIAAVLFLCRNKWAKNVKRHTIFMDHY